MLIYEYACRTSGEAAYVSPQSIIRHDCNSNTILWYDKDVRTFAQVAYVSRTIENQVRHSLNTMMNNVVTVGTSFAQPRVFDASSPGIVSRDVVVISSLGIVSGEDSYHFAIGYRLWGRSSSRHRVSSSGKVVIISPLSVVSGEGCCRIAPEYHRRGRTSSYCH